MGEKSRGSKGIWFIASCFVLKHLPFMLCIMLLCIVEYIEEIPLALIANICNEIQVQSHVHILWGSLLYVFNLFCSLNSLYKPSQSGCHQLPKWGRLKEHGAPMCGFGN